MEMPPAPAPQENNWEILALVWRRKYIVFLVALMGLGLGYLFYLRQIPVYQSTAQILIIKDSMKLPVEGMQFSTMYDNTHETVIRSPLVIKNAVTKPEVASLVSLSGSSDPTAKVIGGLRASGGGSRTGDILKLEYESLSREDCPKVLRAVVEAYQEFLGQSRKKESDSTVALIGEAKDVLGKQITELKEKYHKFRETSPLFFSGQDSQIVNETWLQKIDQSRSDAVLNNSQLDAQIRAIEDALKRGGSREALNLMVGKLSQPGEGVEGLIKEVNPRQTLEERIFPLLLQEQELLEKNNYGPDHPQVKMIRKHIDLTKAMLVGTETKTGDKAKPAATDFYEIYLGSLREKVKMNEQVIASMTELLKQEQDSSRKLSSAKIADENFRSEINLKERLFDSVLKRLEELTLAKDTGATRVELIYPPSNAGQVRPDIKIIMSAAGIMGALAGLALAYLIDSSDRRFRSPDEIRNDFGLPVFGHIPVISEAIEGKKKGRGKKERIEPGTLSPALSVFHHSKGRIAEAYRGVRTAVFFSTRISGHKVFQVTSPSPGDGKTTLVCNLAISVANAGKKVLLLDADFRRPRVHTLFGVKTELGMSSVIEGTIELADAIRDTSIENLSILPCGPRPSNPAELLTSRRFEELLDVLREKYEYVLIDSPPVLAVTDPLNVAPRVDGVILVMRLTKTARHNGRRALEAIEAVGANILGIVVNGVGKTPGYGYGYGYGSYSYGRYGYANSYSYGNRYGSNYQYGYGNGDDKSYYIDEDRTATTEVASAQVEPASKHRGNGNGRS